jgi:hypothetical protein
MFAIFAKQGAALPVLPGVETPGCSQASLLGRAFATQAVALELCEAR